VIVTGTLTPNAVGTYEYEGIYGGAPYFKRSVSPFYVLYWSVTEASWFIGTATIESPINAWQRNDPAVEGSYSAIGVFVGAASVAHEPEIVRPSSTNQLILTGELDINFNPSEIHFAWIRWIYSSINKHFNDRKSKYDLYIEGDERTQNDKAEFAELRIDGPFIVIPQKGLYLIDVEINILTQTHLDPRRHYKAQEMVGTFARAFTNLIEVHKYGDGPLDDGSLLECLHLQRDLREAIDINYYGIIKEDIKIMQSTIEGHYRLELWTKGD
jgi:hypothetical protein